MLNKKNITKLLNNEKRYNIISSVSLQKRNSLKSAEYARYVVDS
jgi:hypothetical protein